MTFQETNKVTDIELRHWVYCLEMALDHANKDEPLCDMCVDHLKEMLADFQKFLQVKG
jgi:truncated hemoglobin YjbI